MRKFAEKIWLLHEANDLLVECKQRSTRKTSVVVAAENHNFRTLPRVAKKQSLLAIGIPETKECFHMELLDARGKKWRTLPSIKYPNNKHLFRMNCAYVLYTDKENTQNVMIIGGENVRDLKKVNF